MSPRTADFPASLRDLKQAEEAARADFRAAYGATLNFPPDTSLDARVAADVAVRRSERAMLDAARAYKAALDAFVEAA